MGEELNIVGCKPTTPMDFETMRQIRNECREFLTRNTAEISPAQQVQFALSLEAPGCRTFAYLYLLPPATWVGYGLRRWDEHLRHFWLTGCLLEPFRGKGYGRQLFYHLIAESAPDPVGLEVRISNLPARRLYESLGFAEFARRDDIIIMKRPTT